MRESDVAIVGGSVAGAALAIHLGASGVRTVVFDKARFPRSKACGEGLLPHGVQALRAMGLEGAPGTPVAGLRYRAPSGGCAEVRFEKVGLGPGLVVRRHEFDAWLLDHARRTPNVEVREGVEVRATREDRDGVDVDGVRARIVVGADGARSVFHDSGRFARTHARRPRVGVSMHVRGAPVGDCVEILVGGGGEAYFGPAGRGEAVLALLLDRGVVVDDFLASLRPLRGIEVTTPRLGAYPLGSVVRPLVDGRTLLIGDAAGAPDPVTGEGMALALLSAPVAAAAIREALATGDPGALRAYERERRRLATPSRRLATWILWASRRRWTADAAVRRLGRDRPLFGRLVRYLCGAGTLNALDPARLLL